MPTFHSVPLHPTLQKRLKEAAVPVETPLALLTRQPQALGQALFASTTEQQSMMIQQLQSQVALGILQTTCTGKQRKRQYEEWNVTATDSNSKGLLDIPGVTISAWQQFQQLSATCGNLTTGCPCVDELVAFPSEWNFGGKGIPPGHVLSLVGPCGVGKTQLALQCALQAAASSTTTTVRYLASTVGHGSLRDLARRCQSILEITTTTTTPEQQQPLSKKRKRQQRPCLVPSNLYFQSIATTSDLVMVLSLLEDELLLQQSPTNTNTVIIVDALHQLLAHIDNDDEDHVWERAWQRLKRMARLYHVSVIVVVTTTTTPSTKHHHQQALAAKHNSDVQLALVPQQQQRVCIQLTKHIGKVVAVEEKDDAGGSSATIVAKRPLLGASTQLAMVHVMHTGKGLQQVATTSTTS